MNVESDRPNILVLVGSALVAILVYWTINKVWEMLKRRIRLMNAKRKLIKKVKPA